MTQDTPAALSAISAVQARAIELNEKAFMPWPDAEALALSEAGIEDEEIDELIGNTSPTIITTLLSKDDVRTFVRAILVHQPATAPAQAATSAAGGATGLDALMVLADDYANAAACAVNATTKAGEDTSAQRSALQAAIHAALATQAPVAGQPAEPSPADLVQVAFTPVTAALPEFIEHSSSYGGSWFSAYVYVLTRGGEIQTVKLEASGRQDEKPVDGQYARMVWNWSGLRDYANKSVAHSPVIAWAYTADVAALAAPKGDSNG